MEIPRHWRLRNQRLGTAEGGLPGFVRLDEAGNREFSRDKKHWFSQNGNSNNGHGQPHEQLTIYIAEKIDARSLNEV